MSTLSEIKEKIPDLYLSCGGATQVAKITGLAVKTVIKYARAAGVKIRPRGAPRGNRYSFRPEHPDRDRRIIAMYRSGKTMAEVGNAFCITRERVRQIIVRDEAPRGLPVQRNRYARPLETRHCALPECTRTFEARPYDSKKYCSPWCGRRSQALALTVPLPLDELIEDRRSGMSFSRIAEKHGTTTMTVFRRLRALTAAEIR